MKSITPAQFGALTLLLFLALAWAAFPRSADTKPVPASVQVSTQSERVKGIVLSMHGGGWIGDRDPSLIRRKMRPFVRPALSADWAVVHVPYPTGAANALAEIHRTYSKIRNRHGNSLPVCLLGNSAGGHLALTYAGITAKRGDLPAPDCVIASSPPTNILAFRRQVALKTAARRHNLERFLEIGFQNADQMFRLSPVRFVSAFESKTLLFTVKGDPVVSPAQGLSFSARLERKRPNLFNRDVLLRGGGLRFVHRGVSALGWSEYREQVRSILRIA